MIHFSTGRKGYNSDKYKPLCTMQWVQETEFDLKPTYGSWQRNKKPMHFSSAPMKVTCIECLKLLIIKKSGEIEKLKNNLINLQSKPQCYCGDINARNCPTHQGSV